MPYRLERVLEPDPDARLQSVIAERIMALIHIVENKG